MPRRNATPEERNQEATEIMMADPNSVMMERDGKTCMAHQDQVAILEKAGWKKPGPKKAEAPKPAPEPEVDTDTPLDEVKAYLEENEVSYHPNTGEAKLRALYTEHKASSKD